MRKPLTVRADDRIWDDLPERVCAAITASGQFTAEELAWARIEAFVDEAGASKVRVDVSRDSHPRKVVVLDLPFALPEYILTKE